MRLAVLRSWDEALPFLAAWESLLADSPDHTICSHPEWLRSWQEAFCPQAAIFLVLFIEEETLLGAVAFYEERRGGFRVWRFLGDGTTDSDGLDVLYAAEQRESVLARIGDWLVAQRSQWDLLELNTIPADSPTVPVLRRSMEVMGMASRETRQPHLHVTLPQSYAEFEAGLSAKMRKRVRQARRLFTKTTVRRVSDADLPESLEALFGLHTFSWSARDREGAFGEAGRRKFYQLLSRRLLQRGALNFWLLEEDGKPIAAHYGAGHATTHTFMQAGFDPTRSKDSPGVALQSFVMERLIAAGYKRFDFMAGDDAYKMRWGSTADEYMDLRFAHSTQAKLRWIFAPSLVSVLRRFLSSVIKRTPRSEH